MDSVLIAQNCSKIQTLLYFVIYFKTYELHYYLTIESSRRKQYKTAETPVVRTYPKKGKTPTKISPIKGNMHVMNVLLRAVAGKYRKPKK